MSNCYSNNKLKGIILFIFIFATSLYSSELNNQIPKENNVSIDSNSIKLYRHAFLEIKNMLEEKTQYDFKRAVFVVDNAFMKGSLDWNWYLTEITSKIPIFENAIQKAGFGKYPTSKNWAIHMYMTDTSVTGNGLQPYQYDYDNYTNDSTGVVYNLLKNKRGNCRSLPYLYKIWCDEFNAKAYLALAPMHVFIKQQDETGVWWNIELTSFYKYMTSEDYIEQSNIQKTALESGLYLKQLDNKENLAILLDDLLRYYLNETNLKFDNFTDEVTMVSLKYKPISETQIKRFSSVKQKLDNEMKIKGYKNYSELRPDNRLYSMFLEMDRIARLIDRIGYKKVSEELYKSMIEHTRKKAERYKLKEKK